MLDFAWLGAAAGTIAQGAATTLLLTAIAGLLGAVLSVLGAAGRRSRQRWLRGALAVYVEALRNTPFLVQLFLIFFGLPSLGVRLGPLTAAALAMTLNLAAYGIEIVGAGIDAVPSGQSQAALALGLGRRAVFFKVVLPQAVPVIFPALSGQAIIVMLESAAVSQIAVRDLTYEADLLQSRTFLPFETYLVVTAIYLALSIALRRALSACNGRLWPAHG